MEKNTRFFLIDAIRGFLIILVVFFHLLYDLDMYNVIAFDLTIPFFEIAKAIVVALFCIISGISINLSKNMLKRSITLILFAYLVTLITYFFDKNNFDLFGILHCLGFSALIYAALKKFIDKVGKFAPFIWGILFIILKLISLPVVNIPHLYALGLMQSNFASIDYYPLIPWLFAFLLGTSLTKYITPELLPKWFFDTRLKILELLGRRTLIIYLIHQPLFIGLIMLLK